MPEDHLLDVGLDLRHGIRELVIGVIDLFRANAVLHGDRDGDEDVVFGLGLHGQGDLIDAQAHDAGHGIDERTLPVQARIGDAQEFAEARDDGDFRGVAR